MIFFNLIYLAAYFLAVSAYEYSELQCVTCKAVIKEINKAVQSEGSKKTFDVGGYSMDTKGNVKKKKKLLVQSEVFLSEVLDKVCEKMSDYVRATDKKTGDLVLVNLANMASDPSVLSGVDIIQDSDLNKSVEHQCKVITEEFEDEIMDVFTAGSATPVEDVCVQGTELCKAEKVVRYDL